MLSLIFLREGRGIVISSIKFYANNLSGLLVCDRHPSCSQCSSHCESSHENLGCKKNILGFLRWVLLNLGFNAGHGENSWGFSEVGF